MAKLIVLRHSKAVANEQGILMGAKLDSSLSENGVALARQRGKELLEEGFMPDIVYTSALKRAIQTAQIFLEELKSPAEIVQMEELNERDFGKYDGKPYKFVIEAFTKYGDNPPTVEPVKQFTDRVIKGLDTIRRNPQELTLVITHSNPVNVMRASLDNPKLIGKYWENGDPDYCQGFTHNLD
jgi:broad specificity phosphatase PhoE